MKSCVKCNSDKQKFVMEVETEHSFSGSESV